jgi:outer membrane protein assembly complex protein YaeT
MKRRRWLRLLTIAFAIVVLASSGAAILLQTPIANRLILKQAQKYLRRTPGIELRAERSKLDLLHQAITLNNVVVGSTSAPDLPPIFEASSIYARLGIWNMLHGLIDIEELRIAGPRVHYFVERDGRTNLPTPAKSSKPAQEFLIAYAEISDGAFKYDDLPDKVTGNMTHWQLSVNGNRTTLKHSIQFSTRQQASLEYNGRSFPIDSLKVLGTFDKRAVRLESAQLSSQRSRLSASGSLNDFSKPVMDLRVEPNLDFYGISQMLGFREPVSGSLSGSIQAKGSLRSPELLTNLKGVDIDAGPFRRARFTFRGRASLPPGQLLVSEFRLDSPDGSMEGNAAFSLDRLKSNTVEAKLDNVNVMPLWKLVRPPFDLATRSSGRISLRWKGALTESTVEAASHLNLSAVRSTPARNLLPVSGVLDARLQSGRLEGDVYGFSVMGAQINGKFSLSSFNALDATVEGKTADVGATLAQAAKFIDNPDRTILGTPMTGTVEFGARAGGNLSSLKVTVSANAPRLQVGELKDLVVRTDATIQDSQIQFHNTITLPESSVIAAHGTLGLGRETTLNLNADTDELPVSVVLSMLGSRIPATGDLKASLHLDGPLNDLKGGALVSGNQVSIYQQPLGRFDIPIRISNGEIFSDHFRLVRDPKTQETDFIDARFSYNPGSDQFQFQVSGKALRIKPLAFADGKTIEGTANLVASGSGTLTQPSIDIQLNSDDMRASSIVPGPISIKATLRNEQAAIEALVPRLNLSTILRLSDRPPYPFSWELAIRNADVSRLNLSGFSHQPLAGEIDATVQGEGYLDDLAQARVSAAIQKMDLHSGNMRVQTQGLVQAEYREQSIRMTTPAILISGSSKLEIAGSMPLQKTASPGTLTFRGQIDLAQAAGFAPIPQGFSAAGILNLDLALAGTAHQLDAAGTILMEHALVQAPRISAPFSEITIRAALQNGSMVLQQANALLSTTKIDLQGELPLSLLPRNIPIQFARKEGPARFSLDVAGLRPETLGVLPQGIGGLVSMHATGRAAGMDLRSLDADLVFRDLGFNANEITFNQNEPSVIAVRSGIASIQNLSLRGTDTNIQAAGSAALFPEGSLNLRLSGDFDAALLTFMNKDLKAAGRLRVQVAVGGNRRAPNLSGVADMNGGRMTLRNPRVVADSLSIHVNFAPDRISIREFKGTLNGGSLALDGTIGYQCGILNKFNLKAVLQDVFLDFPEGLKSASNGTLAIRSSDDSIIVDGSIRVLESSYREPFEVSGQLMSYLRSQRMFVGDAGPSPFLDRIRFNIGVRTDTPLLAQNNIAKVEATANLRIVGSFNEPSIVGRIILNQGGEIVLNQRTYYIQRGTITLTDQSEIKPELDIQAQTRVEVYDITLQLTGPPEKLSTSLISEPALQEPDILSLLLTGKTSSEATQQLAGTQALSLLAGQAGEEVTREARQALHLSTLRLDPGGLIASESDMGARLTLGEDITRNFNLAYSMNLVNGGEQIWIGQYKVTRRLTTQATKQQDNTYRFEFRHDLRFGGQPSTRDTGATTQRFTIGSIKFEGDAETPDKMLRERLKVKSGEKYEFPKVQKGLDKLHEYYASQKRLEADIRLHRETQDTTVNLDVNVNPGPIVDFTYEGASLPGGVKEKVEHAWGNGVFEIERLEDALAAIRRPMIQEGYLQAKITPRIETANERKVVHFHIDPGTRYKAVPILFPGASEISAGMLNNILNRAELTLDVYADPQKAVDYIKRYYREHGFLKANLDSPQPRLNPQTGTGETLIPVHEGPLFTIGDLQFSGNTAFSYDQLWSVIPISSGSVYSPNSLQDSAKALESLYRGKGYNDASVGYRIIEDAKAPHANVAFQVVERRQSVIRAIAIEGNRDTSRTFVERQLEFSVGDVLNLNKIDETRKRLYSTGVYTSVDFQYEEMPGKPDSKEKDIRVRVRVREVRPYRVQYGFFYDTERGPGGLLEAQNLNFWGRASALGTRFRYDSDLKEARLYYNQPFVKNNYLKMDASAFAQRETRTAFSATRVGFSLFRQKALPRKYVFDYGYRYDHVRWNGLPPDPTIFQASVPVARLIGTITRDTRDSILDATRGEFTSHSFEFGPSWLGSETGFTRYSGQYFRYVPLDKYLGKPTKDKQGRRLPASLVYAGALRLGLTSAFDGHEVVSPERFFAGGGTTMRGFKQDLLGPIETLPDGTQRPRGGEALFLFNNEIRFPIMGVLQGVGFVDVGNVYPRISDFNFSLRKSAGIGLRIKVKFIPLRFDYGFKLDRKPGESRGAFFFSIGQAF